MHVILLLCVAITGAYGHSTCSPVPSTNPNARFGTDMVDYTTSHYSRFANSQEVRNAEAALTRKIGLSSIRMLKSSGTCAAPSLMPSLGRRSQWWRRRCEPCQPGVGHLWRFFNNACFVILPRWQRVRKVRCSYRTCNRPCSQINSKCLPSQWHRVWFWGWCKRNVGSWRRGLNYKYLYLPQDCTCYQSGPGWLHDHMSPLQAA